MNSQSIDARSTRCCVVGGGPAGMMLAYILARSGVDCTLLEEHEDFDRDFRGDTLHPSVLRILDELGLAERVLELRHSKIRHATIQTEDGPVQALDFSQLPVKFPYIAMIPQVDFLQFLAEEASALPSFHLIMGASVRELIQEDGVVRGVRYRDHSGWHEIHALLTVAADGRFSRLRKLAHVDAIETSPPMDILWFRLTRHDGDPEDAMGRFGSGHIVAMLNRFDYWQLAYVIPKGSYKELRDAGLAEMKRSVAELVPELADRLDELEEWRQVAVLSVESDRLPRWYQPGLLFIGDAAHTMSPVGGVGINYAIQDAVVAANLLTPALHAGRMRVRDLARVQRKRELPTRIIQALQSLIQSRVLSPTLQARGPGRVPRWARLLLSIPFVQSIPGRIVGMGIVPVHVDKSNLRGT